MRSSIEASAASIWEQAPQSAHLLDEVDAGLQVHTEVDELPVDAFLLVLFLFQDEHVVVEELLETLVGVVDTQLLEAVKLRKTKWILVSASASGQMKVFWCFFVVFLGKCCTAAGVSWNIVVWQRVSCFKYHQKTYFFQNDSVPPVIFHHIPGIYLLCRLTNNKSPIRHKFKLGNCLR